MHEPRGIAGIITSLIIILILGALLLGGCGLITNGMAGMVDSVADNGASVMNTWTQESNATTRTRIEWGARVDMKELDVEIAEINADAQKKTDFTFLLFWVTRLLFVVVGICLLFAGGVYLADRLYVSSLMLMFASGWAAIARKMKGGTNEQTTATAD